MAPTTSSYAPPAGVGKPPTGNPVGYVDEGHFYALNVDYGEHVGDLIWPASVITFGQMRRDPQLAAVLAGITLPIRRANWAIDPTGCNPAVAARVADDMGLPVLGSDEPGPARTRGVSWADHLRTALLSLVYGHSGFEIVADVSSGQARLGGLYTRVSATIAFIHSLPNGDFGGISQLFHPDTLKTAEIGPERMVWYALDVEGSAWHGTSILRPGFSSWLIKQELRRVLAGSNRRWGMGVPTVRALPGTTPTEAQLNAAAQMAQAARGGDTAGAAVPPGFVMEILGMSGSAPNTIDALRWVDQQMSGMVLSRWMDLGSSQTGSRALGESFIDTFLLSIAAISDHLADTATRQIAARLVAWNEGLDEPVPRVVAADVGTRHEVTADALAALMSSGALSADPRLEEWVRRTYRLPARDPAVPWKPPASKGPGGAIGDGSQTDHMSSIAAAKPVRRPRRRASDGQMALPIAAATNDAEPDPAVAQAEAAAFQADWVAAKADVLDQWPALAQPMVDDLAAQASDDVDHDDLVALAALVVPPVIVAAITAALTVAALGVAASAAEHVATSAIARGAKHVTAPTGAGAERAAQIAEATAHLIAQRYATATAARAMRLAGPDADPQAVLDAVKAHLAEFGTSGSGMVADAVGGALSAAQAAGRRAVFEAHAPTALIAMEVNDLHSCQPCKNVDGTHFATLTEADAAYPSGGYVACLGGARCRGHLHAVWN